MDDTVIIREKFGLSVHVPYIRGELPRDRHRRRHHSAMANRSIIESWCDSRSVALKVNGSDHPDTTDSPMGWMWDFRVAGKFAQWRPFAGKLTLKRRLIGGALYTIKCYDYEQLLTALEWWLSGE